MQAVDFVLYCLGISALFLSGGGAVRLMRREHVPVPVPQVPKHPEESPNDDMGLNDRLRAFQTQRFASPVIRKQFERENYTPSPGEPSGPVPGTGTAPGRPGLQPRASGLPPVRVIPLQRPQRRAQKKETSNVVPFPQKQVLDDTTRKD